MTRIAVLLVVLCAAGCEIHVDQNTEIEHLRMPGTESLPFSSAVRVGNLLFLSGSIGVLPGGDLQLAEGGIQGETRQTMEKHFKTQDFELMIGAVRVLGDTFSMNIAEVSKSGGIELAREQISSQQGKNSEMD